jgi:hypothetical protein
MLTESELLQQIRRLLVLPFPPATEQDRTLLIEEYGRIFCAHCNSEEQLVKSVNLLMETCDHVPEPAKVLNACMQIGDEVRRRAAFQAAADERKRWAREYGPPDPAWSRKLLALAGGGGLKEEIAASTRLAMWNTLYYVEGRGASEIGGHSKENRLSQAFWQSAHNHHRVSHPEEFAAAHREWEEAGRVADPPIANGEEDVRNWSRD